MQSTHRRFRDLIHGFVNLTKAECEVVDQPLFQRLRHIRQNDVASFVYPSLNVTRFEHSLGCCHVASRIAASLRSSAPPEIWELYKGNLNEKYGLQGNQFEQTCRLYALLHDVGHLPFSHLFETALDDYAAMTYPAEPKLEQLKKLCEDWFGPSDFKKPHESFGRLVAQKILAESTNIDGPVKAAVLKLLCEKAIDPHDPLRPVKMLVDSEVDADRIDATARDGKLAGGEYGNYDIERLCSGVRLVRGDDMEWGLGYSRKSISSLEGLLLDRYRTHTWIHFHHRVVAMKCAMRLLVARLLKDNADEVKAAFVREQGVSEGSWRFDDVWLWSKLREKELAWNEEPESSALKAVLHRRTDGVHLLWKDRLEWAEVWRTVADAATNRLDEIPLDEFDRRYETELNEAFRNTDPSWAHLSMRINPLPFSPLDRRKLPLVDDRRRAATPDLRDNSPLCGSLEDAWQAEPQLYVVVFGDLRRPPEERVQALNVIRDWWTTYTAAWLGS